MADVEKNLGGRPPYQPNEKDRRFVENMARFVTHDEVALVLGISDETMRKYYRHELDTAKVKTDAAVGQSLILQAVGGVEQDWKQAVTSATIFYCKTRMGWKEQVGVQHSGSIGSYDFTRLSDEQLVALDAILEEATPPDER